MSSRRDAYPTLLLAFAVTVWGCTPRVTAVAGPHADPLTLTMLRAVPTAILLLAALPLLRSHLPRDREVWLWTAVSGLLMVTLFLAGFTEGVIHAGPGNAIVLATTAPFWVVVLSRIFLGERASLQALGGLVLGFVGIVLIVSSQLGGGGGGELAAGMGLALAAAFGWGAGTLVVKQLLVRRPDVDAMGLTTGQYLVGGAMLLVISSAAEGRGGAEWSSGELWLAVAFISVVGRALATLAYFGALRPLSADARDHLGVSLAGDRRGAGDRPRSHAGDRRAHRHGRHDRRRRHRHVGIPGRDAGTRAGRSDSRSSARLECELKEEQ